VSSAIRKIAVKGACKTPAIIPAMPTIVKLPVEMGLFKKV